MRTDTLLTRSDVRYLCGSVAYTRGKSYYELGRVASLARDMDDPSQWHATVRGTRTYQVMVGIDDDGVAATCGCPAFSPLQWCKHVAAVLLNLVDYGHDANSFGQFGPLVQLEAQFAPSAQPATALAANSATLFAPTTRDAAVRLLQVFRHAEQSRVATALGPSRAALAADARRTPLQVEFFCQLEVTYFDALFKIEMKVGPQRTYVVKDIREFLTEVEQRQRHVFTKSFTYDGTMDSFQETDVAIIHILQETLHEEALYRTSLGGGYSYSLPPRKDRTLLIPPAAWERLRPLLLVAKATLEHKGYTGPLQIAQDVLPITARVLRRNEHTHGLFIEGVDQVTLLPRYHCAVCGTNVYPLDELQLTQLTSLRELVQAGTLRDIPLRPADLGPIINEVLPGLRRIAHVHIDKQLSELLIERPLSARVYLDRADEVLRARVEYGYGETVIHPLPVATAAAHVETRADLETTSAHPAGEPAGVIVRDLASEQRVLRLLEACEFSPRGQELQLTGEQHIYHFLFVGLPQLRQWAQVYATSAVDAWTTAHVVKPRSRVELDSSTDWLDVSFDMGDLAQQDILQVLQSMIEKKPYHRLRDGSFVPLEHQDFAELGQLLENLGVRAADLRTSKLQAGALRLPALRALPLIDDEPVPGQLTSVKLGKSLRHWLDDLRNPDNLEFELPPTLAGTLRDYQKFGFQWMKTLSQYGFGGILADDMGLGKTLQSIAYLVSERAARQPDRPALIVCPASLTFNWLSEIHKFAPQLRAAVVSGDQAERFQRLTDGASVDVLITSYPLLWRDVDAYTADEFDTLILDEAQAIKNHTTKTAQAVTAIRSPRRFALTGTPVENSLDDLWSIFLAVFPSLLGGHQSFSRLAAAAVAKRIRPFILRRLKSDVLKELPDKIETLLTTELTRDQKQIYLAYLAKLQADTTQELATEGFQKGRFRILAGLTRLRQICCHPALCVENYGGDSGKLAQLLELVEEYVGSSHRILIFSQFTSMLRIIRKELSDRNVSHFYLDGQTPAKERLALCERFNAGGAAGADVRSGPGEQARQGNMVPVPTGGVLDDTSVEAAPPIFLISLKAGGTGLNLTGADTVILYDLWWNPAVEEQAADRAHRIGQKQTVQVIRMITQGTVEEKMYQLQEKKRDLIDQVVHSSADDAGLDGGLSALTEADIRELLAIGAG